MRPPERLALPALAVFLAGNVLPRTVVFVHQHAGGEHVHVHPWGERAAAAAPAPRHDHHHHHARGRHRIALEAPDGDEGLHSHWQHPYQLGARPAPAAVAHHDAVAALVASRSGRLTSDAPRTAPARAPPGAPRV
jgi:hypothetical protein